MKSKTKWARGRALVLWVALGALMAGGGSPLSAQTTEGTTITNRATASYTDANSNTYADVFDEVSVTVGFAGALTVTEPTGTNSTNVAADGDYGLVFTIANGGNGSDVISVTGGSDDPTVATITGFVYNTVTYPTELALNAVLALDSVPYAGDVTVEVLYNVPAGQGGNSATVTLTATSTRDANNNSDFTLINVNLTGSLAVTSDVLAVDRLPSNGTVLYTTTFQVESQATGTTDFDLDATLDGTNAASLVVTRIGETGFLVAGSSTTISFAAGETREITVEYRVDGTPAQRGSSSTLTLTVDVPAVSETGSDDHAATIIAPVVAVTKTVHANQTDALADGPTLSGDPLPGDQLWYRVEVTNSGDADAVMDGAFGITDDFSTLPVTYVAASLDGTGSPVAWDTLGEASEVITGTMAALPGGSTAWFVFAVTID